MMEKDDLLQSFIKRSVSLTRDRLNGYVFADKGKRFNQRYAFIRFEKYITDFQKGLSNKRWVIVPGLRGTGKTTLLAQLFYRLSDSGVPLARMPYASLDELTGLLGVSLREFLDAYEIYLGKNFESLSDSEKIFLFIDEAHYDKNWSLTLKNLYDRTKMVFIFTTGSSSISLQTSPDTARRSETERLFPLSLTEYLLLKRGIFPKRGVGKSLGDAVFSSRTAKDAFESIGSMRKGINEYTANIKSSDLEEYLRVGTLPFSIPYTSSEDVYEKITSMVEKTIAEDISTMMRFTKKMQIKMSNLIVLLAISDRMSYQSLCNALGDITKPTLSRMIRGIEKAELIHAVKPYGLPVKKIAKTPKYKFMAPSTRAALLWQIGQLDNRAETSGKLLEDAVALYLYRLQKRHELFSFEFDPVEGGADFVVTMNDKSRIVLEVGYGDKGIDQAETTMTRIKSKYGVIVSDRRLSLSADGRIVTIPKEWFLLM